MAGQNETLTQFHAAVTAGISAILNAAQAPGWQHLWNGINPQDQIVFCTKQQPSPSSPARAVTARDTNHSALAVLGRTMTTQMSPEGELPAESSADTLNPHRHF